MNQSAATGNGRRVRNSRSDIVEAALQILNDSGLPDLTMRRLGEVLGVQPSALYWHFESKQALLAAVSARVLSPLAEAEVEHLPLPAATLGLGLRLRDSLLAHRDGAELVSSSLALGLIEPPIHARLADVARSSHTSPELARTAADAVTHFVIGYIFQLQQRRQADALGVRHPSEPDEDAAEADQRFQAVLTLLVTGLIASTERPGRSRPSP